MRVSVISDLHLEFADLTLPGGDVLILSGDVMESKNLKPELYKNPEEVEKLGNLSHIILEGGRDDRRVDRFYRFMKEECSKYREVIYVSGNHEYYGNLFNRVDEQIRAGIPDNVKFLQNESHIIDGVLFLGATLWTDMNGSDDMTMFHLKHCMNDFRVIKYRNEADDYHRFSPEIAYRHHKDTMAFFEIALQNNRERAHPLPVVVVTHHAPSKLSIKPRYADDHLMNGGYSSDLSEFILDHPEIRVWTHGHTHDTFDYMIGSTRILCNPRGYKGYEQQAEEFDPTIGFDI